MKETLFSFLSATCCCLVFIASFCTAFIGIVEKWSLKFELRTSLVKNYVIVVAPGVLDDRSGIMKVGNVEEHKIVGSCLKPMSYSDSVKQATPRNGSDKDATRPVAVKTKEQLKMIEGLKKEKEKLKKSLDIMKGEYGQLKTNYSEMVARKKEIIKEKVTSIKKCLLLDIDATEDRDLVCQDNAQISFKRINTLNRSISTKIASTKESIENLETNNLLMKKRNERDKELIDLLTINWNITDRRKGRKKLEKIYEEKKIQLKDLEVEVTKARKLLEESGQTKQEDFMKKRIQQLKEQVESRVSDVERINEKLSETEKCYEERCVFLENLKGISRELRHDLSEPILNRRHFNLCLKENFNYDQRLREVLEERERVQFEYGAVMEELKNKREQYDTEEKTKEKLFMSIMTQLDEGQQYRIEHENIQARINQMHSEIFVRHGFMHAKENAIMDLTTRCNEMEIEIIEATRKELFLKEKSSELEIKLTEILFDICFAISWDAVGQQKIVDEKSFDFYSSDDVSGCGNTECKDYDSCEVIDLDTIEKNKQTEISSQ